MDELAAGVAGLRELGDDVVRGESDVVDAAVRVLFQKLRDGAVGRGRLEELEVDFTDVEESRADFLAWDFFGVLALQAEGPLVIGDRILQRTHRNAEVVNALQHLGECAEGAPREQGLVMLIVGRMGAADQSRKVSAWS